MLILFTDDIQIEMMKRVIFPEFNNFIADHDNIVNSIESSLDGIEDHFNSNDNSCIHLMSDANSENNEAFGKYY